MRTNNYNQSQISLSNNHSLELRTITLNLFHEKYDTQRNGQSLTGYECYDLSPYLLAFARNIWEAKHGLD